MARTRSSSRIHMSGRSGKRLNNRDQVATEVGATANGSPPKRRKITDWKDDELFSSGQAIRPRRPYFVTRPNPKRKYELHVPRAVVRVHKLNLPMNIVYIDERGRKFPAKRKQCKDGRIVYTKGWKDFCSLNLLGEEDKIICEFICEPDGEVVELHTSFVRAEMD